ncbi:permease [Desulfonatronovibrio hydrogenovorans]|uniref:permease n=1 Tax=Desulfonatronovibrio hydrogenovorans TaxID=53245 RepID=UPI000A03AD15|nr:permease [Desulfonatronovibrio hydrogenovorans]
MKGTFVFILILCLTATFIAFKKDPQLAHDGLIQGLKMLWKILPILVLAFILAGMMEKIIPRDFLAQLLGWDSGLKGLILGTMAGAVMPGGPFILFPMMAVLMNAGAGIGPLVAFLSSWALVGLHRVVIYEAPIMGWKFTLVRLGASLIFPVIIGYLSDVIWRMYSKL